MTPKLKGTQNTLFSFKILILILPEVLFDVLKIRIINLLVFSPSY